MKKKVKKGIDIGAIVLVCIIFLLGAVLLTLTITKRENGIPRIFGVAFFDIQTESMSPKIKPKDIVIAKKTKNAQEIKVGDVITFWDSIDLNGDNNFERVLNTHRVTEIVEGASELMFKTRGDNNEMTDEKLRAYSDIEGIMIGRLPKFGYFTAFLMSIPGFLIFIVLPLSAFLIYRIIVLVKVILEIRKEKLKEITGDTDALKAELEALRAKVATMESTDENVTQASPEDYLEKETDKIK